MFDEHIKNVFDWAANERSDEELKNNQEKFVLQLLGKFQLLELILKKYIDAYVAFELRECEESEHLKGLEDLSLGILIRRLRKVTGDNELADRIHALLDMRNDLAHNSLLVVHKKQIDKPELFAQQFDYISANSCLCQLLDELGSRVLELYTGRKFT
ncbi:hypothetical protein K6U37_14160 [Vibrio parahaemolyticus]|uniref:hypothetical protein n=1 Tax=Vibrio parahaemolyticus TaxID=670 RepID=UPI001EEADA39|nr:hypothetical protein [Vibrio parahaemolyticus]MCG6467335.1 hypothetical protein [Vibrio parahaemolyticus]MCG6490081.1 hypothetical protein [Vibrio parahaemolyticus]